MTIQQGQCTVFKKNCLSGKENFTSTGTTYVYKIALYTANADLSYATTAYTTSNEVSGTGYTAGGIALTPIVPATYDQTAYVSFNNATWTGVSFTCRGALIYNSTTNAAVAVLDFGSDKQAGPNFVVTFPTASYTTAIIRFS
jgi:hypothetical protein